MDDGHIFARQEDAAPGGGHRNVTDFAGRELIHHVLLGDGLTRFVNLDVIVRINAGESGGVRSDYGAVAVFEESYDLLFVGFPVYLRIHRHFFLYHSGSVQADVFQEDPVIRVCRTFALLLFFTIILPVVAHGQSAPATSDRPFVAEYYYKTKWGHADEFLKLFKKNHFPLLKKEMEMGRIAKVWMDQPRYHTTEDGRWDYRVTIVFKNATVANEPFDEAALQKQMYPDQDTFQREEQRRFEILDAHWDLPVKSVDLEAKP